MTLFQCILMGFLIVCAISVSFSKNLLNSVLIYMSYSLVMSVIWVCLQSPDLAITEAAVGAGVTSILFFATLKKIHAIQIEKEKDKDEQTGAISMEESMEIPMDEKREAEYPNKTFNLKSGSGVDVALCPFCKRSW